MTFLNKRTRYTLISLLLIGGTIFFIYLMPKPNSDVKNRDILSTIYRDSTQSVSVRVEDLLNQMTINEKIGQLALVDRQKIYDSRDLAHYGIGGLLSGGGSKPSSNTPQAWLDMVNEFQRSANESRLGIPLLYGIDAVHGHTNVPGATIFPHAIGLGASRDADLVYQIAAITTKELIATGIFWNFSPSLDIVQDTRWGRTYETFGSNTQIVRELGVAYINGLQSTTVGASHVIGTAKHFLGTGAMVWGTSENPDFKIDQGLTDIDETTLRSVHLLPFIDAVNAGVGSIMVGHTSWNGMEIAANKYLLTDILKNELGFKGFVVSDWYGVYEISDNKYEAVVMAINAGVDMVMLPFDYKSFTKQMQQALLNGDISTQRLDDAVRRIMRVKFELGLFDNPLIKTIDSAQLGSSAHREVAREAVRKSLVLLKNDKATLPLSPDTPHVLVVGSSAHNLGRQSGGWTVEWQGVDGNGLSGTTILDAIKQTVSEQTVIEYDKEGDFPMTQGLADIGIAVVGEKPYAEGWGDDEHPRLTDEDLLAINRVKKRSKKLVIIIISGRPLDIRDEIRTWDAVVAAWLPGSEGEGVTDVLFGKVPFVGTLPVEWPL
ncbi:MAG: Glycoside hydrolase family 3 domain protein [Candidatus Uhrbacteria bacterium GW2011_GWF2_39_13]|uniref:beta-glucosidase n=1 Tax=Candidatus Uhrbacteria bacterium GW2011_GWF2_39_13 TaxID=1618995 RepID=A0A0G0MUE0_9BACT|nr:MAG: Glycoside hydrolase family 3 domain protein [Candidatus Uhrbacteria bacterium GW2011_GWF2_39_13]HAU66059.1 beta-glucosidase [Candidatus Uhrbacteria bacterium]